MPEITWNPIKATLNPSITFDNADNWLIEAFKEPTPALSFAKNPVAATSLCLKLSVITVP